jgi:aerobic-type carbon monoxide dehydrogenase small subunit (CoxS/CutS family)
MSKARKGNVTRRGFVKGAVAGLIVGAAATYGATTLVAPRPTVTAKVPAPGRTVSYMLNDSPVSLYVEANWTLQDVMATRARALGLTGAKKACDYGECGACSVIVNGKHMLACMMLAIEADGKEITTIEGLAKGETLHPIQTSFKKNTAFQCGYCTPGMIMASKALLDENPNPTEDEVRRAISGNLCRCGEYARITKAIMEA